MEENDFLESDTSDEEVAAQNREARRQNKLKWLKNGSSKFVQITDTDASNKESILLQNDDLNCVLNPSEDRSET